MAICYGLRVLELKSDMAVLLQSIVNITDLLVFSSVNFHVKRKVRLCNVTV